MSSPADMPIAATVHLRDVARNAALAAFAEPIVAKARRAAELLHRFPGIDAIDASDARGLALAYATAGLPEGAHAWAVDVYAEAFTERWRELTIERELRAQPEAL
jgi:hypothetical protein